MLAPITRAGHGKNLALLAWTIVGFLATLALWSLLVGDWQSSSTARLDPSPHVVHDTVPHSHAWQGWPSVRNVFCFGDSYSENGFATNSTHPTPDNPYGNTDRALNYNPGLKWVELLHDNYSASSFMVYDFARSGAYVETYAWEPRELGFASLPTPANDFREQATEFEGNIYEDHIKGKVPFKGWAANSTLFTAWFGVNEILRAIKKQSPMPLDPVFASYTSSMDRLYRLGARNFLILNVPPVDRIVVKDPNVDPGDLDIALEVANFNARLARMHEKLLARRPDATWFFFDVHALWSTALSSPDLFPQTADLRNTTDYCEQYTNSPDPDRYVESCGAKLNQYFWLNSVHPTYTAQNLTAGAIRNDCWANDQPSGHCTWDSTIQVATVEVG